MVQVRCPECGYLQTLSEERFLSISDDFLNCPHCNARVPKQWTPVDKDAVPEEQRHKMLAFSRRILNGGEVPLEMVRALEALVRHHGPMEDSYKALGLGYFGVKDWKKAEECLLEAYQVASDDPEILRCLLAALLGRQKFSEAVAVGRSLMDMLGRRVRDEDVARVALAFIGSGKEAKARELLDSYPDLDQRDPLVKQAQKELNRTSGLGLGSLFGGQGPIHRLLYTGGRDGLRSLTQRARTLVGSATAKSVGTESSVALTTPTRRPRGPHDCTSIPDPGDACPGAVRSDTAPSSLPLSLEFWIYAVETAIPGWEEVRNNLAGQFARKAQGELALKSLASLMEGGHLQIDYLLHGDANELFHYPEELLPRNAKELSEEDRNTVLQARMIVRVRLAAPGCSVSDTLAVLVRFVESLRRLTDGVVQDALSHTLWGVAQWRHWAENAENNLVESQIRFEALDEGDSVWIHTHGMQKFGLPELEIENIPAVLVQSGLRLMFMAAKSLLASRESRPDVGSPFSLPGTPILLDMQSTPPDMEGHFPSGSLKIVPYLSGGNPKESGLIGEVLQALNLRADSPVDSEVQSEAHRSSDASAVDAAAVRERLLEAHRKALVDLPFFKQSFRQVRDSEGHVHAVKIGFPAVGGKYEWMWVSLNAWRGESLEGLLQNSPMLRKDLRKGARVHVTERQIFDWVIVHRGDVVKGAYTEAVLA